MTEAFSSSEDFADSRIAPLTATFFRPHIGLLRMILCCIGRWNQYLFFGQYPRTLCVRFAFRSKIEDMSDDLRSDRIRNEGLLIIRPAVIAVGDAAATAQSIVHSGIEDRLDLVAGVLRVPFIHDVKERCEVISHRLIAVHAVIDGDEPDILLRKKYLGIITYLRIIPAETAHGFHDHRADRA